MRNIDPVSVIIIIVENYTSIFIFMYHINIMPNICITLSDFI